MGRCSAQSRAVEGGSDTETGPAIPTPPLDAAPGRDAGPLVSALQFAEKPAVACMEAVARVRRPLKGWNASERRAPSTADTRRSERQSNDAASVTSRTAATVRGPFVTAMCAPFSSSLRQRERSRQTFSTRLARRPSGRPWRVTSSDSNPSV